MRRQIQPRRLRSQLVFSFLAGFLGIALVISVPVIVLLNRQTSTQAQYLLDEMSFASQAFIDREQSDLQSLALLVSQRPTLQQLLDENDPSALNRYLETLQEGALLDLIVICEDDSEVAGTHREIPAAEFCNSNSQFGYIEIPTENDLFMFATANLSLLQDAEYRVIVGKRTSTVLADLGNETSLLYFIVQQDRVIHASSPTIVIPEGLADDLKNVDRQLLGNSLAQKVVTIDGHSYLWATSMIDSSMGIQVISALNVDNQLVIQQSLNNTLIVGLIAIFLIVAFLGVWQSQRISKPIVNLANAAAKFRLRDLDTPVSVHSSIWEINQFSNALEDARIALQHSMDQLQAEKTWIEHLLNSIVEGILTLDEQDRITFASAGVSKIVNVEMDHLLGKKADDIFLPVEGETPFTSQLPAAGQQRRVSVMLKSGQESLLSISKTDFNPPNVGSNTRALVIRDVTDEAYIHRLLGDFMSNVTHEFRTPLSALAASTELLLDNLKNLSPSELEELLVSLNLGITNLQALIDNLIEAASMEAGRFKVSPQLVPFEEILLDTQKVIDPLAKKYGLHLSYLPVEEHFQVVADRRRTVQVMVNLLSNAIKHSPEKGSIQVRHSKDGENLRVEIVDEGGGVPVAQREYLFRRFAHLDIPSDRAKQGAGLGLSVVKAIVEAQGGEVGITDLLEGGTSFWFTVPLAKEPPA